MIYTTLNRIREHSPCADGWRRLLTHLGKNDPYAPLAYSTILDAVGLDDALWCLRAEQQHANIWRMFAVRCARRVQHLITDVRSLQALDVAERHARGEATDSELTAARTATWAAAAAAAAARAAAVDAARAAAWDAARAAAWDAAWAAAWDTARDTARDTAWDTAWDTARSEQPADFEALLVAHQAIPWESCALVDWWQGESK